MRCYKTCYENAMKEVDLSMRQLREVQIAIVSVYGDYMNILRVKRNIGESVSFLSPFAANAPALAAMLDEVQDIHSSEAS